MREKRDLGIAHQLIQELEEDPEDRLCVGEGSQKYLFYQTCYFPLFSCLECEARADRVSEKKPSCFGPECEEIEEDVVKEEELPRHSEELHLADDIKLSFY